MEPTFLVASGVGEAIGQAIGSALGAAFLLLLMMAASLATTLVLLLLIGLRQVPRTTALAYGLGIAGSLLGSLVGFPPLAVVGAAAGAVVGWRRGDPPIAVFRTRGYTLLLGAGSGLGILTSAVLLHRFATEFGGIGVDPIPLAVMGGILLLPGLVGAGILVLLARDRRSGRAARVDG